MDGVMIGHPCCGVQDCFEALQSVKDRFCSLHGNLNHICAVKTCVAAAEVGYRTCTTAEHRSLETNYQAQGKAMFQLKHRLERAKLSQTHDSLSIPLKAAGTGLLGDDDVGGGVPEGSGVDDDEVEVDKRGICAGKPESGNRSIRAMFGRRRTHNEELCVTSCGIILGRATFYGSEAPNGVRVSLWLFDTMNRLFQFTPLH